MTFYSSCGLTLTHFPIERVSLLRNGLDLTHLPPEAVSLLRQGLNHLFLRLRRLLLRDALVVKTSILLSQTSYKCLSLTDV